MDTEIEKLHEKYKPPAVDRGRGRGRGRAGGRGKGNGENKQDGI